MKLHKSIVVSVITIVLSSCGSSINLAKQPSISTPGVGNDVQIGNFLEVTAPNGWNSFRTDEPISLEIRNVSESLITSTPDFGVKIFVQTDEGWLEVKNKIIYENDPFTLDPSENYDPLKTAAIFVRPDLFDYSVPYDIRIFVVGNLAENGNESKRVASYIDLRLSP